MSRYALNHGIVLRRTALPSGDVVVTVFGRGGKWRGIARKGKKLGGLTSRLSLFNDVEVQLYQRRPNEDLPLIIQVVLTGALPRLSDPNVYPYAHVLAELVDRLTSDHASDRNMFELFASGLRGIHQHENPSFIALLYAWRMLKLSGFAPLFPPHLTDDPGQFDVAGGAVRSGRTGAGIPLTSEQVQEFFVLLQIPLSEAIHSPPADVAKHWAWLHTYVQYHVHTLNSLTYLVTGGG